MNHRLNRRRLFSLQAKFLALNIPLVLVMMAVVLTLFEIDAYRQAKSEIIQKLRFIVESQSSILAESALRRRERSFDKHA